MKAVAKHLTGFALLAVLEVTMLGLSVHLAWRPLTSNSLTPIAQVACHSSNGTFLSLQPSDATDDATVKLPCLWPKPAATLSLLVRAEPQSWGKPRAVLLDRAPDRPIVHRRSAPRAADDDAPASYTFG